MIGTIANRFGYKITSELSKFLDLRLGLDRAYVGREENLSVLRGKILTGIHVGVNAVHPHRLYVAYDDFNADTMLNRLLKGTCQRLLPRTTQVGTQQVLRECLIELSDVQDIEVKRECFSRVFLSRNNERFAPRLEFVPWLSASSPHCCASTCTPMTLIRR